VTPRCRLRARSTYDSDNSIVHTSGISYQLAWERQLNALTWPISVEVQLLGGHNFQFQSDLSIDRRLRARGG
jgi:hypothetical protein